MILAFPESCYWGIAVECFNWMLRPTYNYRNNCACSPASHCLHTLILLWCRRSVSGSILSYFQPHHVRTRTSRSALAELNSFETELSKKLQTQSSTQRAAIMRGIVGPEIESSVGPIRPSNRHCLPSPHLLITTTSKLLPTLQLPWISSIAVSASTVRLQSHFF